MCWPASGNDPGQGWRTLSPTISSQPYPSPEETRLIVGVTQIQDSPDTSGFANSNLRLNAALGNTKEALRPMVTPSKLPLDVEAERLYQQALNRIQEELGWSSGQAHEVLSGMAAGHGVFLHDIAAVVVSVPSLKRGLPQALNRSVFDHRPLSMR